MQTWNSLADKYRESQFELAAKEFNAHLDNYRLDMAANTLYEFIQPPQTGT
ncbi:hypothetical protein OK016_06755 [Vibrio chagasii]|nr:hypothetical protein [Vibrio chagasii]